MRVESSVTSLSWIPSEAVTGLNRAVFDSGVAHYDDPPPDTIDDLAELQRTDRFRFANRLAAWVDIEDGIIVGTGYTPESRGLMGATTVRVATREATFAAPALPDLRAEPEWGDGWVRFVQTVGGRTALPAPRRVNHPPFVQFRAPLVWSTLSLTLHGDGRCEVEMLGASVFPRHWVYDGDGVLVAKAGLADFKQWYRRAFGKHSPWGNENSRTFVTAVETALERDLASRIMRGGEKPTITTHKAGAVLVEQGEQGNEVFLLLDGVLVVEVDGEPLAELGPGAIVGERAVLEDCPRTATLRAVTTVRIATARAEQLDRDALAEVALGHRREELPES
jgi:cAMP-binding proteins - catabolite gene activator and regulatory subunit of cAMP-dependent protein kinases